MTLGENLRQKVKLLCETGPRLGLKPLNVPGLQHLADPSLPRETCTATRPSQASPNRLRTDLLLPGPSSAFKADMTCLVFASQFKPCSGGQGESMSTQNVASVHEESPSDQEDQSEGDPPVTVPKRFWRAHEDSKSHSPAHDVFISSQTRPVITQFVVQAQSTRSRSV